MLRRKHLSIAMEIVQDYALHVLVAVKESAKVAKAVAKTDAKPHVEAVVGRVAKAVANNYAKAIA